MTAELDAPRALDSFEAVLPLLGVDSEGMRIYRLLLAGASPSDVARLAAPSGLTVDRVVAGLARLRECGFVVGDAVAPPGSALRALVHQRRAENHQAEAELERTAGHIDRLVADLVGRVPEAVGGGHGPVQLVVGVDEVARHANEIVGAARTELLVLNAPPYVQPSVPIPTTGADGGPGRFPAAADPNGLALERGVRIRTVIAREGVDTPHLMAELPQYVALGLEVRVRPTIPTKLIVADRSVALLPPTGVADPRSSGLLLRDGLLMNVLVPFFEEVWEAALPLGTAAQERRGPSDDERALLGLLAGGLKDEAIARQLDVHVHTARRRISALLTRLGAETRFQAGIQAARRGWLA